jgi:hypothetical protein
LSIETASKDQELPMRARAITAAIAAPADILVAAGRRVGRDTRTLLVILALTPAIGFATIGLRAIVTLAGHG